MTIVRTLTLRRALLLSASVICGAGAGLTAQPAAAQETVGSGKLEEIVITARKRTESIMSAPVAVSAINSTEMNHRGLVTVDAIARSTPAVMTGDSGSGFQGGNVVIRGLSGADANALGDQAVSFVIDGVQVAKGNVRRLTQMDMEQIEILKGPQTLFYGKNSPAGVINMRTADPTSNFQAGFTTGYEFNAREERNTAFVSAPITDTLGIRVAGLFSDMQGYLKRYQPLPAANVFGPDTGRAPQKTEYAGRVTLKWEPTDKFSAKYKLNYQRQSGDSSEAAVEIVHCGLGTIPQTIPANTPGACAAGSIAPGGELGPNFSLVDPHMYPGNGGKTFMTAHQILSGLELNYDLTDTLRLTSQTGYYLVNQRIVGNFTNNYLELGLTPAYIPGSTTASPQQLLASSSIYKDIETTEEVRLSSSFPGWLNFMAGGLYSGSHTSLEVATWRNALTPLYVNNYYYVQSGKAYSFFGQLQAKYAGFELSGGGRYSHENKKLLHAQNEPPAPLPRVRTELTGPNFLRDLSWNDFSPDVTLTYHLTPDAILYGSYRQGFLSGGYNANQNNQPNVGGAPGPVTSRSYYNPQKTKGFEVGVKATLLDETLRVNAAAFTYKTTGLQVAVTTNGTQVELRNAGASLNRGFEAGVEWQTPKEGLVLNAAGAYTDAKYTDYQASCYRGQSSATCFNQVSRITGQTALLQDLSNTRMVRAPKFQGTAGFSYSVPLTSDLKFGLTGDMTHSDSYITDAASSPGAKEPSYEMFNASVRVAEAKDLWEVAFIGRNLTDKHIFTRTSDTPFTGTGPGASTTGVLGDSSGYVDRGRELMLQLTVKFGGS